MLNWLITVSLRHRFVVCVLSVILVGIGARALWNFPIDVFTVVHYDTTGARCRRMFTSHAQALRALNGTGVDLDVAGRRS